MNTENVKIFQNAFGEDYYSIFRKQISKTPGIDKLGKTENVDITVKIENRKILAMKYGENRNKNLPDAEINKITNLIENGFMVCDNIGTEYLKQIYNDQGTSEKIKENIASQLEGQYGNEYIFPHSCFNNHK